jgi:hypothetical protein
MIEMHARLYCDRCNETMLEMNDVDDLNDAHNRVADAGDSWGCEDEDGNDVCHACWRKWDAKFALPGSAKAADAVDPHAADPGKPTTRA